MGTPNKKKEPTDVWGRVLARVRAKVAVAKTLAEKQQAVADGFEALLREHGFDPEWVGLGTVLVVEFIDRTDAEKVALWFGEQGMNVDHVAPAEHDMGPCVVVNLG